MRKIINVGLVTFYILVVLGISGIIGCASIQKPTGGPRDSAAPIILRETPKNFTTNFKGDEIDIQFDEYFKLANQFKEISISPELERAPAFKIKKKVLNIQFPEPPLDSTTYTINFGKGITDNNEGNVLKNYIYVFSTGTKIDSLSISGKITNSLTKEPVLDATVFLLTPTQDSLFGKKRASIFTTTDSSGNYSIKYLRSNSYKVYALKEEGGDRIYNSPNEQVGFYTDPIALTKDTSKIDIEIFKQDPLNFRVTDRKIEKDGKLRFVFNKSLESPDIQILDPADLNGTKLVEYSKSNDTATVWTQNTDYDSISVSIVDKGKSLDTLLIRRNKRDTYNKIITITDNLRSGRLKPGSEVTLISSAPIKLIDPKKISLLRDSVPIPGLRISKDSLSSRILYLKFPWQNEKIYSISIADNGLTGTFGGANKLYTAQFTKDTEENYGSLTVIASVPDTSKNYIFQLLNEQDDVIYYQLLAKNGTINLPMMALGRYYIRVIYDANKNGIWDTGNVSEKRQPEQVWNFEDEVSLKANWVIEKKLQIPKPQ